MPNLVQSKIRLLDGKRLKILDIIYNIRRIYSKMKL